MAFQTCPWTFDRSFSSAAQAWRASSRRGGSAERRTAPRAEHGGEAEVVQTSLQTYVTQTRSVWDWYICRMPIDPQSTTLADRLWQSHGVFGFIHRFK